MKKLSAIFLCAAFLIGCDTTDTTTATNTANSAKLQEESLVKLNEIKNWKPIIIIKGGNPNYAKYILIDKESIEILSNTDKRYENLHKNETGKYITSSEYESKITFALTGKDIWDNNKSLTLFLGLNSGSYPQPEIFDGQYLYAIWSPNPDLSENPNAFYITLDDKTSCPLKLLAYYIYIDDTGTVNAAIVIKNTSRKSIVAFEGIFKMYDKMGNPVTWGGGNNQFPFISQNQTFDPASPVVSLGFWKLTLYENTRRLKPAITSILFSDGSKWIAK